MNREEIKDLKYKHVDDYVTQDGSRLHIYEITFTYADRKGVVYFMASEELVQDTYISMDDIFRHQAARWIEKNL